jgi:predicted AAA+ superfamily ATPase
MVPRALTSRLRAAARKFPVVTVTGPRQSGKTTLCRAVFPDKTYVSLEAPDVREYARTDPRGFLGDHRDGAILDEIQRVPELLSYLQIEVDARRDPGRFVLTGSANLALLGSASQSLAGRTAVLHLLPLSWSEVGRFPAPPSDLWTALWKGGYPAIYDRDVDPTEWLAGYVATYVERDVRQILNVGDLVAFQTFVRLCAGRSAQLLNLSALAADAGVSHVTARSWISVLESSFVAFRLLPYHSSLTTRLVKTPKLHFYDSGLLCYLLGIRRPEQLREHPLRGAVFETWVVDEVSKVRLHAGVSGGLAFFRDRKGREVDLLVGDSGTLTAVETKSAQTVHQDFFAALAAFAELVEGERRPPSLRRVLVYGGVTRQQRSAATVLPWSAIDRYDWLGRAGRDTP